MKDVARAAARAGMEGKAALVTGASSGIGLEACVQLARDAALARRLWDVSAQLVGLE